MFSFSRDVLGARKNAADEVFAEHGGEAVRSYPVRIAGDHVELDLTPPDPRLAIPGLWNSLDEALTERRIGQATRDAARLLQAGILPPELSAFLAAWNGVRAVWGSTHVLALANDVLRWQHAYPGPQFAIPLAQVLDLAGRDGSRRPARVPVQALEVGADAIAAGQRFQQAVESEDAAVAEGLLLGALAKGWRRAELEPWFFQLVCDHFMSGGHRLIFQIKLFDLLEVAGWQHAEAMLRGHLFGIVSATRSDVLPAWAGFRKRLAALDLDALHASAGSQPNWSDDGRLFQALLTGRAAQAFEAVTEALTAGAPLSAIVDVLSIAAAERMLRFDIALDSDDSNQDNWLSVTHVQTYAHAIRQAITRDSRPDVLKLLYYGARNANHHQVLDGPIEVSIDPTSATLPAVLTAIQTGQTHNAVRLTNSLLDNPSDAHNLRNRLMDVAISDGYAVPIVSAHAMKNLLVAFDEWQHTGDKRHVLAVVRLLASPLQQRWTHRGAKEAVAFVTEGTVPRVLAP